MRKRVVDYDDVMNKHRQVVYQLRNKLLTDAESSPDSLRTRMLDLINEEIELLVNSRITEGLTTKEIDAIVKEFITIIPFDDTSQKQLSKELVKTKDPNTIITSLKNIAGDTYDSREKTIGNPTVREIEKYVYLTTLDEKWMDHLDNMESLRDGIGLRGYAQRDPLVEYQKESYSMFERLIGSVESEVVKKIYRLNPVAQPAPSPNMILRKDDVGAGLAPVRDSSPSSASPTACSPTSSWTR